MLVAVTIAMARSAKNSKEHHGHQNSKEHGLHGNKPGHHPSPAVAPQKQPAGSPSTGFVVPGKNV